MKSKYKHSKVIKAFVDGVKCELWYTEEKKWIDVKYLGDFDLYYDVRIKPHPIKEQESEPIGNTKQLAEPVAVRYDFDGYGYIYMDAGSGSDWASRVKDCEFLYTHPMREWISVKDKLPEMETPVLAIVKGQIRMAEIRTEYPNLEDTYSAFEYWDCPLNDGQDWQNEDVTHWMPLPNPPMKASEK